MSATNFFQFLVLVLCTFCFISCSKETEKLQAGISYFIINDTTSIIPNADLIITAGCREYRIQPKTEPEGANIFVAINDNAFKSVQNGILLHDSINKISAFARHPGHAKSNIVSLNIHFQTDVFAGNTSLFPNPATHYFSLMADNSYRGPIKLTLFDLSGTIYYTTETEKINGVMELRVDLSNFDEGLYIYKLEYETCELHGKLVINR